MEIDKDTKTTLLDKFREEKGNIFVLPYGDLIVYRDLKNSGLEDKINEVWLSNLSEPTKHEIVELIVKNYRNK
jgi:hypothetical protein